MLVFRFPTVLLLWSLAIVDPSGRDIRYGDILEELRPRLAANEFDFGALRDHVRSETAARLEAADRDALVFFVLQSDSFTSRAAVDPVTAAMETAATEFKPTVFVRARVRDFLTALEKPSEDQRFTYWQTHLAREQRTPAILDGYLHDTLDRIYGAQKATTPTFTGRNLSSDTTLASSFAISGALVSLRRFDPEYQLETVLVVGPGQDFVPPTGLHDEFPPQSFEPYLAADALLGAKLTNEHYLTITCFDINPRVLHFLDEMKRSAAPKLTLASDRGSSAFNEWFDSTGRFVGNASADAYRRIISIRPSVARKVTGEPINIVTQRLVPSPEYDLVIVMDVLRYYREKEVGMALANIQSMLRRGGYLIHNDSRPEALELAKLAGFDQVQSGSVNVASKREAEFFLVRRR